MVAWLWDALELSQFLLKQHKKDTTQEILFWLANRDGAGTKVLKIIFGPIVLKGKYQH